MDSSCSAQQHNFQYFFFPRWYLSKPKLHNVGTSEKHLNLWKQLQPIYSVQSLSNSFPTQQTPNKNQFHSTPASIHRSQSNFSFHEYFIGPTISRPPNFSQILATSETNVLHHVFHSKQHIKFYTLERSSQKTQYETSALATSTSSLKRSLDFPPKTCLESQPKLARLQWSEKAGPQSKRH